MEDSIKDQWIKEVSLDREDYIEEIALMVVEKLVEMNKEHNLDLVEMLQNNVEVRIIPIGKGIEAADEVVPENNDEMEDVFKMQKAIMDRVLKELKKKEQTSLMS